jgi:hypothetical protein
MRNPTTSAAAAVSRGTPHASLAALGVTLRQLDRFGSIRARVQIPQEMVRYAPTEQPSDAFIALLAGAHGLVEINRRLRADPALQAAFGQAAGAEQSVVQDTLDAATAENVSQLEQAPDLIYRRHSQGYRHDHARAWQVLDVARRGLPCGKKAAFATTGYFARQRNRRGRRLGRVIATPASISAPSRGSRCGAGQRTGDGGWASCAPPDPAPRPWRSAAGGMPVRRRSTRPSPTSIAMIGAAAGWRPPSRKTSTGWG